MSPLAHGANVHSPEYRTVRFKIKRSFSAMLAAHGLGALISRNATDLKFKRASANANYAVVKFARHDLSANYAPVKFAPRVLSARILNKECA